MKAQLAIIFHPDAETELYECFRYYETQIGGLGETFLNALDSTIQHISTFPKSNAIAAKPDIRRALLQKFPISIIYRVRPQNVEILALAHTHRRPFYWANRTTT